MKLKLALFTALFGVIGSAHAGTYLCDIELDSGKKTTARGISANSESHAARLVKESNSSVKYINCMRVD
jgi:hypothetical protein